MLKVSNEGPCVRTIGHEVNVPREMVMDMLVCRMQDMLCCSSRTGRSSDVEKRSAADDQERSARTTKRA